MGNRITSLRRQEGQALVELALVIPLLLFVLFAIIDFGEALNQYNDTTNLANIGVRAAVVASTTPSNPSCTNTSGTSTDLTTYLRCEGALDSTALTGGALTVCSSDTTNTSKYALGDTIQVKVSDTFNWLQIMFGGIGKLGGAVGSLHTTISSVATMREEANNTTTPSWIGTADHSSC